MNIKKRLIFFLLFSILLLNTSYAVELEDSSSYSLLRTYITMTTDLTLNPTSNDYRVDDLIAELKIYPKNTEFQSVSNFNIISNPTAITVSNNEILYKWDQPQTNTFNLGVSADVISENKIFPIKTKIKFPLSNVASPYSYFTGPSPHIDINEDISRTANDLATGESDLYVVVFKIAEWVRTNVAYNLTTMTANVVQKSSWVYVNKQGVCDEITSLFISMLRSIGIPARFVEGVAYTNQLNNWGNHGWAEVYFPEYGWVPFDVTYGQYGFVDATHIRLGEADDSSMPSMTISGRTKNVEINADDIKIKVELIEKGEKMPKLELIKLEPLSTQVGPGSYVPIKIELENLQPFYVPVQLRVSKAPALTEDNVKTVLLKPLEKDSVFWIVKIPEDIEDNYIYTTLIEVVDSYGFVASENINYASEYDVIGEEQANSLLSKQMSKEELFYSEDLKIDCQPVKDYYYDYEQADLICATQNIGNVVLSDLKVCVNQDCRTFNMNIAESRQLKFADLPSNKELKITAKNAAIDLVKYTTIKSLNEPNLRISNLNMPELVFYNQPNNISFLLSSDAKVKNLVFKLNNKKIYNLSEFNGEENRIFILNGKQFYGPRYSNLSITYLDTNGRKYQTSKSFMVNVRKSPFYAMIFYLLGKI